MGFYRDNGKENGKYYSMVDIWVLAKNKKEISNIGDGVEMLSASVLKVSPAISN